MTAPAASVAAAERIETLDVLRGLAILGILFMNMPYMAAYGELDFDDPRLTGSWSALDQAAFGVQFLIEGTMRGLLQMLFGAGMMIALRHTMRPDGPVAPLDSYLRRNLWLVVFGLAHALILMWPGDILFIYGLTALFLPPFRHLRARAQFWLGVGVAASLIAAAGAGAVSEGLALERSVATATAHRASGQPLAPDDRDALARLERYRNAKTFPPTGDKARAMADEAAQHRGSAPVYWLFNTAAWAEYVFRDGEIIVGSVESLGAMLIGAALFGWGVITGRRSTPFYWRLLLICYGLGLGVRALALDGFLAFDTRPAEPLRHLVDSASEAARLVIATGHIAAIALLIRSRAAGLVRPLAANGVLPLTTYIGATILVQDLLMPGYGGDQWGRHGFAAMMAIAAAVIALQCLGANLWLRAGLATGPLEWLWKTLAYGRRQRWRTASPA